MCSNATPSAPQVQRLQRRHRPGCAGIAAAGAERRRRAARQAGPARPAGACWPPRASAPRPPASTRLDARLRHGEFVDTVLEMQADARLFVLGEHYHASGPAKRAPGPPCRARDPQRPAPGAGGHRRAASSAPQRFVIAFDGSADGAQDGRRRSQRSPMLAGLPVLLAMVGADTPAARRQLDEARDRTRRPRASPRRPNWLPASREAVLPGLVKAQGAGAAGDGRLRPLAAAPTGARQHDDDAAAA